MIFFGRRRREADRLAYVRCQLALARTALQDGHQADAKAYIDGTLVSLNGGVLMSDQQVRVLAQNTRQARDVGRG